MIRHVSLSISLLLAACSSAPSETKAPDPVAQVRTALAETGQSTGTMTLYGVAEASAGGVRSLAPQSEAIVDRIVAPSGTVVGTGQVVATLRPSAVARLDLARASSDARGANAALARTTRLRADGLMSNADVDAARATAAAANATLASLGARSGSLTLRAPVGGTVQGVTARPGDIVAAGTSIATIAATGQVRARFGVDPASASRIRAGQRIRIMPVSAGASMDASVTGVDIAVDPVTRQASVYAALPAGRSVAAGETLRAIVETGGTATGTTIPYAALLDDGGQPYVFVLAQGVARKRDVVVGNGAGDRITILRGVEPGARVVTEGGTALEDGMKVRDRAAK